MQHLSYTLTLMFMMSLRAHFITQDNLGHIYIVDSRHALIQANDSGRMIHAYREFQYGEPGMVDASNPQKILCYSNELHTLTYLSSDLNLITEIPLTDKGFSSASAVCQSYDGNTWLFSTETNSLRKVDVNFREVQSSADFSNLVGKRLNPHLLFERDNKVFICDSTEGVFVLDIYGYLLKRIPKKGIKYCDSDGKMLYYIAGQQLMIYNLETFDEQAMPLQVKNPTTFSVYRNRLVVASPTDISVFNISRQN